jgi:hypothetical protein
MTQNINANSDYRTMSDSKFYKISCRYGSKSLKWRWIFMGTLPEMSRRGIYLKRGYSLIYEFAARRGGVPKEQVSRVLNLEKKLADRPILRALLTSGSESVNKLRRIETVATPENEMEMAEKIKLLPVRAVETFARDINIALMPQNGSKKIKIKNGLFRPIFDTKTGHVPSFSGVPNCIAEVIAADRRLTGAVFSACPPFDPRSGRLELDEQVTSELLELKEKGIDINAELREFLESRKREIEKQKAAIHEEVLKKEDVISEPARVVREKDGGLVWQQAEEEIRNWLEARGYTPPMARGRSRHIPAKVTRILRREHGTKCARPGCARPAQELHHLRPFSHGGPHSPFNLEPLCAEHHLLKSIKDPAFCERRARAIGDV